MQVIIESKRPIVGHHMSLDMLFIFHSFIKELPDSYISFLSEVKRYLVYIFLKASQY